MAPVEVSNILIVKQLQTTVQASVLNSLFGKYGDVLKVKVCATASAHIGIVVLNTIKAAMIALANLNGKPVMDRNVVISYCPKVLVEKLHLTEEWRTEMRDSVTGSLSVALKSTEAAFPKNKENIQPSHSVTQSPSVGSAIKTSELTRAGSPTVAVAVQSSETEPARSTLDTNITALPPQITTTKPSGSPARAASSADPPASTASKPSVPTELPDTASKPNIPVKKPVDTFAPTTVDNSSKDSSTKSTKKKRHRDKSGSLPETVAAAPTVPIVDKPATATLVPTQTDIERKKEKKRKKKEKLRQEEAAVAAKSVTATAPVQAAVCAGEGDIKSTTPVTTDKPVPKDTSKSFLNVEPLFVNHNRLKRKPEDDKSKPAGSPLDKKNKTEPAAAPPTTVSASNIDRVQTGIVQTSTGTDAPSPVELVVGSSQTEAPPSFIGSQTQTDIGAVDAELQTDADKRVVHLEMHLQNLTEKVVLCEKMAADMRATISTMKELFAGKK